MATAVQNATSTLPEHPLIAYGIALDPFIPQELQTPPGLTSNPPNCPHCTMVIHAVLQNAKGDIMFECLNQGCVGYMAVLRVERRVWEQNPNLPADPHWVAPGMKKPLARALTAVATPPPMKTKETKAKARRRSR